VRSVDPFTPWVDSSPSNATSTATPTTTAAAGAGAAAGSSIPPTATGKRWGDPNDPKYGDIHFYDYGMDCEDSDGYPNAKFVSEHGVQSFPSMASYKQVGVAVERARS
ncbi:unnamed protein product, partial [Ectocarpus sp. 13 AM-2016]